MLLIKALLSMIHSENEGQDRYQLVKYVHQYRRDGVF